MLESINKIYEVTIAIKSQDWYKNDESERFRFDDILTELRSGMVKIISSMLNKSVIGGVLDGTLQTSSEIFDAIGIIDETLWTIIERIKLYNCLLDSINTELNKTGESIVFQDSKIELLKLDNPKLITMITFENKNTVTLAIIEKSELILAKKLFEEFSNLLFEKIKALELNQDSEITGEYKENPYLYIQIKRNRKGNAVSGTHQRLLLFFTYVDDSLLKPENRNKIANWFGVSLERFEERVNDLDSYKDWFKKYNKDVRVWIEQTNKTEIINKFNLDFPH